MTAKHFFHFTIGPVQNFVAQARRTRDFWAGSFILSWLSAVAMHAVQAQKGKIIFPRPDTGFMKALESGGKGPQQGNVPNRFKAEVEDGFDPRQVEMAVRKAWKSLADGVWYLDLEGLASMSTRDIWNRQIKAFWDIQWVLEDGDDPSAIDRLKNWRTQLPSAEPGVKCMVMDGWQELSGARAPSRWPEDPEGPAVFWRKLRESGKTGITTDLRPGEMLCAIGYIKRRFVRCFHDLKAELAGGLHVHGWPLPAAVPSVQYMAAAPWLALLIAKASGDEKLGKQMWEFHDAAYKLTGSYGEWNANVRCVKDADGPKKWKALDGTVFFDSMLENGNLWEDRAKEGVAKQGRTKEAEHLLEALKMLRKNAELDPVSPFYAVLLMDGDELGAQMAEKSRQPAITGALADFTGAVPGIVKHHNGFLVYAGGDDVLALLPLEDALGCAAHLRRRYMESFEDTEPPVATSISGAIEYAHIKMPLGKVLGDAHRLLDEVAKDGRGRDAIACRVWKPGGLAVEWAMPWECALNGEKVFLEELAEQFRAQKTETEITPDSKTEAMNEKDAFAVSAKFFHRIRQRFDLLNPASKDETPVLGFDQAASLLAMEYLNSGVAKAKGIKGMDKARETIKPLLVQCRPRYRDKAKPKDQWTEDTRLYADGAILVHFLAKKGVER